MYNDYDADNLYTEDIPYYAAGLPSPSDQEDEFMHDSDPYDELLRNPIPERESSVQPLFLEITFSEPLSLTLDKNLILPNNVPATALYSLNYTLNTMGNSFTLSRSVPSAVRMDGTVGKIMDKDLHDITRPPLSLVEFAIHGKRKSTFPGQGL